MVVPTDTLLVGVLFMCLLSRCARAAPSAAGDFAINTWDDNLQGDVIILDYGSLLYAGNHPFQPVVTTADQCATTCEYLPGCNAFTFCSNKNGCGSGCAAFDAKTTTVVLDKSRYSVDMDKTKLPILTFGPLNGGWGCAYENKDAWSFGTCSLKKVKDPLKPNFWPGGKGQGWISGTISRPTQCGGYSTSICRMCLKASNQTACYACIGKGIKPLPMLFTSIASSCAVCYGSGLSAALQARCLQCFAKKQQCAWCATSKFPKLCFECFGKLGNGATYACLECLSSTMVPLDEAGVARCIQKCLPALRKSLCTSPYQDNCVDEVVCPRCASNGGKYLNTCISCAQKNPSTSAKCGYCVKSDNPGKCFQCANQTSVENPILCRDCVDKNIKDINACIKCSMDPKNDNRGACSVCSVYFQTTASQKQCYKCLTTGSASSCFNL